MTPHWGTRRRWLLYHKRSYYFLNYFHGLKAALSSTKHRVTARWKRSEVWSVTKALSQNCRVWNCHKAAQGPIKEEQLNHAVFHPPTQLCVSICLAFLSASSTWWGKNLIKSLKCSVNKGQFNLTVEFKWTLFFLPHSQTFTKATEGWSWTLQALAPLVEWMPAGFWAS